MIELNILQKEALAYSPKKGMAIRPIRKKNKDGGQHILYYFHCCLNFFIIHSNKIKA